MRNYEDDGYMHPYVKARAQLREEQVMVFDDVTEMPTYDAEYITDDMVIAICHKGRIQGNYGDFAEKNVAILLPKQIVRGYRSSDDFQETVIAISSDFFETLRQQYLYTRYTPYYRIKPITHLTDEQYQGIINIVNIIRIITRIKSKHRTEMLIQQISILLNIIGEFRIKNDPEEKVHAPQTMMFNKFYECITEHYHEAHEVNYYAKFFNLSPKYFATIIKEETGISATKWITDFLIVKAKALLSSRRDLSMLQISMKLGFSEQASFSRYFKTHTGMTASEYRNNSWGEIN